ncbi:long-chain-fatty-acid--CoA ligase 5 isoform X2 [Lingula anatina]|uniref:Long-chain-fatty-acid--CoA ligase n=1 Tax=Lingula anatina TaxID=7574 RepID=A0A1S3H8P6_LINAN|nr:long-chain-fatty-acid--CoA ligase 5 isoform X2 [Lingula anatina]|eukprot:XP_013381851.1 long-chain-fatty-acid--CoA ligase 5 isoform X2 [Lingula anatina]
MAYKTLSSKKSQEEMQSVAVEGDKHARVSMHNKEGKLLEYLYDDAKTCYEAFTRGARVSNNGPSLGWRDGANAPYQWISYNDVLVRAADLGAGMQAKGMKPENTTCIGIYSQNRPEYVILEQACYMYSMVVVPLYDTLGPDACSYILKQAEISMVICDTNTKVNSLLSRIGETPGVKTIVVMEEVTGENNNNAMQKGVELITFKEVETLGKANPKELNPCTPEDLAFICYTSGTTGDPKGAQITHKGIIATASSCGVLMEPLNVGPSDVLISYLPLAHVYEQLTETFVHMVGGKVGFFRGDIRGLLDDLAELKPTLFPSVPRLLNRIYDKAMAAASASKIKNVLLNMALNSKEKDLKKGIVKRNIWDKIVFKKIQQSLGGRVKLITSGSAPLSPKVLTFMRCAAGCVVIEGFGQTECSGVATCQMLGEAEAGHVGPPLPCCMVKVVDVPEMGYFADDDKGEVCVKGPNLFSSYLKNEEKTSEALDDDGWLHTGDIGEWLPNGTLKIIDRIKHIFKLSQGEYIAPEKIETVYVRCPLVAQSFIHGDSLKSCLVAVVVPDPDTLPKWAKETLGLTGTMEQMCANQAVKEHILKDMTDMGKAAGLKSFEQVKDIHLHHELFSVENGLLTPTFKSKRQDIKKFFATQLDEMYSKLD